MYILYTACSLYSQSCVGVIHYQSHIYQTDNNNSVYLNVSVYKWHALTWHHLKCVLHHPKFDAMLVEGESVSETTRLAVWSSLWQVRRSEPALSKIIGLLRLRYLSLVVQTACISHHIKDVSLMLMSFLPQDVVTFASRNWFMLIRASPCCMEAEGGCRNLLLHEWAAVKPCTLCWESKVKITIILSIAS